MTNAERYKTAVERKEAYREYVRQNYEVVGEFAWLELEYKEVLKPCPFCDSEARVIKVVQGCSEYSVVECKICLCRTVGLSNEGEAIAAWNRRAK